MHHYGGNVVPSPETQSNGLTTATMTWVQSYNGTFSNTVGESLSLAAASVEDCDLFAAWTCCLFLPWRAIEERVWKYFPQLEAVLHLSNFKCQDYYKKKKSKRLFLLVWDKLTKIICLFQNHTKVYWLTVFANNLMMLYQSGFCRWFYHYS